MDVDTLIQLMRTKTLSTVRKRLEKLKKDSPEEYAIIVKLYQDEV